MQHTLVAEKKRLAGGCKNAVVQSRRATKNVECANVFFYMHTNAVWQSLYVRSTKNWCPLLTFTENFAQILIKCTFGNSTLWMTHRLGSPGPSPRSPSLCRSLVTTLCKFYRCSKTMCNIALCVHCEHWIPVPL